MPRVLVNETAVAVLPKSLALVVPGYVYSLAHDAVSGATNVIVSPIEPRSVTLASFSSVDDAVAKFKSVCMVAETFRLENEAVKRMNDSRLAQAAAVPLDADEDV
jgi:hypothetical protein